MKRPRKTKLNIIEKKSVYYSYICPFCKTIFNEYGSYENVVRIKCSHCENEIIFYRSKR